MVYCAGLKKPVPIYTLRLIYNSLILSHLNYGQLIWGSNNSRLTKLQKKSVRIICNTKYNAHTDPLFNHLQILKLKDIFRLHCLKFYHKFLNSKLPTYFDDFLTRRANRYNTRNTNFMLPQTRTTGARHRARYLIPLNVNCTDSNIKDRVASYSIHGLTNYFKNTCVASYQLFCNIANCYICNN